MHDFLKKSRGWLSVGWFWPLVLLALPNCAIQLGGLPNPNGFKTGTDPTSAVMCDIPTFPPDGVFQCATQAELPSLIAQVQQHAAIAFNEGEANLTLTLDYSPAAYEQCGVGVPRKVEMFDAFPKGTQVCLNCTEMFPIPYPNTKAVCVAKCRELVSAYSSLQDPDLETFCQANARVATNFDPNKCYDGICTTGGTPSNFADPRLNPKNVTWIDLDKANTTLENNGLTLKFNGPGNDPNLTGGAASQELITTGDAWVEFEAGQLDKTHVLGLRTSCDDVTACPDQDYSLSDVTIGISLNVDNKVNVVDYQGTVVAGPFPNYALTERFRIHVVDRHDGKADLSFSRGSQSCIAGTPCIDTPIQPVPAISLSYPLRVDTTFREAPASLLNVTIMRIIENK